MRLKTIIITATFSLISAGAALSADRAPNADERSKIEAALKADGYNSWGRIELDDGTKWEVDDAVHSDGHRYDLELSVDNLAIIDRDRD